MEFRKNMLETGDVDKLVIVTNKNIVRVYIKKDSLRKALLPGKLGKSWPGVKPEGPHFEFKVTKADEFEKRISTIFQAQPQLEVPYRSNPGR